MVDREGQMEREVKKDPTVVLCCSPVVERGRLFVLKARNSTAEIW